uniref:Sulfotransferase n=1 Tax=Kalanchoe fedtschenkoi TaxID=63787 RepID=A0A7N0THI9_KALFE
MADATCSNSNQQTPGQNLPNDDDDKNAFISALPTQPGWISRSLKQYQGFWLDEQLIPVILSLQQKFRGKPDHIVLTSYPKSGTTWLKALLFSITNRSRYHAADAAASDGNGNNPLVSYNPHVCVPRLERYAENNVDDPNPDQVLFNTHLAYSLLPKSMIHCGCKIVYVAREPKDVLVSLWHFAVKLRGKDDLLPLTFNEAFDMFCNGVSDFGPYWDHVMDYWNAHLKFPHNFFFITYEDLMEKPVFNVKKLAHFIGQSFTIVEEERCIAEEIVSFCSFEKLGSLEVNKTGTMSPVERVSHKK